MDLKDTLVLGGILALIVTPTYAGTPVLTFSAPNPAVVTVSSGGTATVEYTITNQSIKPKNLKLKQTTGVQASVCYLASKNSSCHLTLVVNGSEIPDTGLHSGPILCEQGNQDQCYQPAPAYTLNIQKNIIQATSIQSSTSELALSIKGLTEYGIAGALPSGAARMITITNTGNFPAVNLRVATPIWPSGTTSTTTCGNSLAANSSCTITVTPGTTPTSNGINPCSSGNAPVAGTIQVSSDNANTVATDVVVLSYGCIYNGGYIYAFDDSIANTISVGGKVAALTNQADPAIIGGVNWSSDASSSVAYDAIFGISEISTKTAPNPNSGQVAGQIPCDGPIDGVCDTNNIYVYYQNDAPSAPINLTYYAAGLCKQAINGYSDWYLPAICELGYAVATGCGTAVAPTLQNMQSSLVNYNNLNLINGYFWSSTEYSAAGGGADDAWTQEFNNGQVTSDKAIPSGVRCTRVF